ncbi:hypothetical protein [Nitrogeniibacter aestuarii]|uniref:hypothetical protein n=1 Tax=Nitrogeniibacter aestuarii TaxID=2815343 RepID=UPI001D0F6533|nr:hypothetical protein [Nitrogeniibacter aestuarii]
MKQRLRVLLLLLGGFMNVTHAATQNREPAAPCLDETRQVEIRRHESGALTICEPGSSPDCHADFHLQAHTHRLLDLNSDGREDLVIKLYSGLVGIDHDLHYFSAYLKCSNGRYDEILFDAFTRLEPADQPDDSGYRPLNVERNCHDETTEQMAPRRYRVSFNTGAGRYGPPDGEPALVDFCGAYEQSLPASRPPD